jgi:DGQHR domain-containing protein
MSPKPLVVKALRVQQWLKNWEKFDYSPTAMRRQPKHTFYLFKLDAHELKRMSGIQRRSPKAGQERSKDIGIQRRHEKSRSEEISRFVLNGYPWSGFAKSARESGEFDDLRKPGWLPTAVVVNILEAKDRRRGQRVVERDLIKIHEVDSDFAEIEVPSQFREASYIPEELYPIEIIDGQHRLWAFEEDGVDEPFELPVVAFLGLDISWEAYLFYTINIKPKRINPSLAYDLYPLLRTEDWLEKFEGKVYRETRAQELTEMLWRHPRSPWHNRINMLGTADDESNVSQAAWVRALLGTYVKSFEGARGKSGGLFGAPLGEHQTALPWSRAQQAAFLIYLWQRLQAAVKECEYKWAESLREGGHVPKRDPAFSGKFTLLNQDQGVRGVLFASNDLCFAVASQLDFEDWQLDPAESPNDEDRVSESLATISKQRFAPFLDDVAAALAKFDWRTASSEGLSEDEKMRKLVFRGSGGYSELKRQLLELLSSQPGLVGRTASSLRLQAGDGR